MRRALLICALAGVITSTPQGYFHQSYQSHHESASYKNNELQHKNEDDGFYSKHGDLEGASEPKVNQYSHHTEYRNPNSDHQTGSYVQHGVDPGLSQHYEQPNYGSLGGSSSSNSYRQGASTTGSRYQTTYGDSYGNANQNTGTSYSSGQLDRLQQQLQEDLSHDLRQAVARQEVQQRKHGIQVVSTHPGYTSSDLHAQFNREQAVLEQELKSNLTRKLQEAVHRQYSQQHQDGTHFYNANNDGSYGSNQYSNAQLQTLQSKLQDNLVRELQQNMHNQERYKTLSSTNTDGTQSRLHAYPNLNGQRDADDTNSHSWSSHNSWSAQSAWSSGDTGVAGAQGTTQKGSTQNGQVQAGYVQLPVTLTELESTVQDKLSRQIQKAIVQEQNKYSTSVQQPDINDLSNQLRDNLTETLRTEVRNTYGNQQSYTYTSSAVQELKQRLQSKLLDDLQQQLRRIPSRVQQSSSHYQPNSDVYSRYDSQNTHESSAYNSQTNQGAVYPSKNDDARYHTATTYEIIPSGSVVVNGNSENLHQLAAMVQDVLNRQLQSSVHQHRQRLTALNSYDYQQTLQQLTEELKQNLTQQLNEELQKRYGSRGQQYTVSSTGIYYYPTSGVSAQQLQSLSQQLQNQLVEQLQTTSQQYSSSSSYSQSAGYSSGGLASGVGHSGKLQQYGNYNRQPSYGACCGMQNDAATSANHHTNERQQLEEGILPLESHNEDRHFASQRRENIYQH